MKLRVLFWTMLCCCLLSLPAAAQQDPYDLGEADSVFFEFSQPSVAGEHSLFTADLYFFNDVQYVMGLSAGFSWDNPNLELDSARWIVADTVWDFLKLTYYKNNIDSTNAYQYFSAVGGRMYGHGLSPTDQPWHILTYYFHLNDWTVNDSICIALEDFNTLLFADEDNIEYTPVWRGDECVFDPDRPQPKLLQVFPSELSFDAETGGPNPADQPFAISEVGGENIGYSASPGAGWLTLSNEVGTTPDDVGVSVDITGLDPGIYGTQIHITSVDASNEIWMPVTLDLVQGNRAPILDPIGDRAGNENQLLEFPVTASDPDMTIPSLTTSALPGTAGFTDHGNGSGTFSWLTTYDDAGDYPVTFTASDGDLTDEETITITINNVNRAPELAAIGSRQVLEGVNLNFLVSGSDLDGGILTLSGESLPGDATFTDHGNNTGTFDWTPGNTDADIYDVLFIASDGNLADSETVTIEVIDADGFLLGPNPLVFTADLGGASPAGQAFDIWVSDGSTVGFSADETADWFSVDPAGGTTPTAITVTADITGLAAGFYRDSITIGGTSLDDVWEYVELTINNNLVVAPTSLNWNVSEGDLIVFSQTLDVSELGGDYIAFEATTEASFLVLTDGSEMTPGTVTVDIDKSGLNPGIHESTITISSAAAANSPLEVPVTLTITPCPMLVATTAVTYDRVTFAGETVAFDETISLTSSGPAEIEWEVVLPVESPYSFDPPLLGITPGDVAVHYERLFEVQGLYADTAYLSAVETEAYSCPSDVMVITNVTVNRPPSADTIIVVNTPAVPGMRVGVPVIFTNSCQLTGLSLVLAWESDDVHLDSVSFVGSAVEYVDDKGYHELSPAYWMGMHQVTMWANTFDQQMVPIGSEQLLANLHFSLGCEIDAGAYEFIIGEDSASPSIMFTRDCGEGEEIENPEYIPGSIVVGTASNFVCGWVVDPLDNEIEGATVELWEDYPFTEPLMSTSSSGIGSFAFDEIMVIPFDLYAYKEGYYPGKVEDVNFGDKGVKIVLEPLPEILTPTSEWVDYYCPEGPNIYLSAPVPVGAVVEAYTDVGLLVGQKAVEVSGQYGFMPVYRGSEQSGDIGAMTGDMIHFTINGMDAITTGNTAYPAEYAQMEVCLEVRGTIEKECTLFEGWNLISWNVNTETDDILTVLAPIMDYVDVVLGFEQGGLTFDPDLQVFSTLWEVDHYSGYWVRIEGISEITLAVSGLPSYVQTTSIFLTPGWNLVSYIPNESMLTEDALTYAGDIFVFAYGFPNGQIEIWEPGGQFNQLETFDPCNGYWLKTTDYGVLKYTGAEPIPAGSRPATRQTALGAEAAIATANWINLYSHDLTVDGEQVPTGATITAHAAKNDDLVGSFTMTTDGRFGFMPVYADIASEPTTGLAAGDDFYLQVNEVPAEETFTWTGNGDRIEVTELSTANSIGDVLPQGYSLAQNYPNPFNPGTSISFTMAQAGMAKIEIFNVLGRSVAVVFDGQAQTGENTVAWDGRDAAGHATASGVYFYRMTADNYTETRKMMLLK